VWEFSEIPKPNLPEDGRDPGVGGDSDDNVEVSWDIHRDKNKEKPEASGSKHEGSNSYRQHRVVDYYDYYVS
jgi:hypothetical protein